METETRGFSDTISRATWRTNRWRRCCQQLVYQQQLFQQSLEMQRQQSQAQMETLTNLGTAQVAKTTCNARDFQTKAFVRMKGSKGDEKNWVDWRYKFRVELARGFPSSGYDLGLG